MSPQGQPALLNEEAAIKALLTPDQLAAYPDFQQSELVASAKSSTQADLTLMAGEMDLSPEQQDKAQAALYQLNLNQASIPQDKDAIAQARATGNYADVINLQVERQKQSLQDKLNALDGILTPDQLNAYKQKQMDMLDMEVSAMKILVPSATNAVAQ